MNAFCVSNLAKLLGLVALTMMSTACLAQSNLVPETNSAQGKSDKKIALVIGNSTYKNAPALSNAVNDARDMCGALKKLGFETHCYENLATKRAMKDAIANFYKPASNAGVTLFFYAGHGVQLNGENYLIPTSARIENQADVEDESISVAYFLTMADGVKNLLNIVVLDACRNTPFTRGWRSVSQGGLAPVDPPEGSVLLYATAPGKVASDGDGRNGLFTKHLIEHISKPGLTIESMVKQVSRGVKEESERKGFSQSPWWNSSFTGNFCFAGCGDPQQARYQQLENEKLELEKKIRQSNLDNEFIKKEQENQLRITRERLEARVRELESNPEKTSQLSKQDKLTNTELEISRKQLDEMNAAQAKQASAHNNELALMTKKMAELEKQKAEAQKKLEEESRRLKLFESQAGPSPQFRKATVVVPPAL